jgi:hypothetical protein
MWSNGLFNEVQAAIGRYLREEYDLIEPIPARLADLLRQLDQLSGESGLNNPVGTDRGTW